MSLLPAAYADLEPFAAQWSLPTAAERAMQRSTSTKEERQAFYDAMCPRAAAMLDELDTKPLAELDDQEKRLLDMLLAFSHVSLAIEIQGADEEEHAKWRNRMVITRAPADLPN
ncbi:hypothetical protein [Novosphingobium sp. TH158]|uniref:hypothetical protein n=1 Tax=Novosphingobium sp. TH158 TaxID=2067455 RepID=UPI001181C591|nr:hypothetical protein [Novosphingobium sp. TH158]